MKVSKFNQSTFSIKIKNPWTHMVDMLCRFNTVLTCYNIKIITFTWLKVKRQMKINHKKNQ